MLYKQRVDCRLQKISKLPKIQLRKIHFFKQYNYCSFAQICVDLKKIFRKFKHNYFVSAKNKKKLGNFFATWRCTGGTKTFRFLNFLVIFD